MNPKGKVYVCGFLFDREFSNVLLSMRFDDCRFPCKVNGIGTSIPAFTGLRTQMAQIMREQANVATNPLDWTCFHTERYLRSGNIVHYMTAYYRHGDSIPTIANERIDTFHAPAKAFSGHRGVHAPGLEYLIPMALAILSNPGERALPI